MARQTRTLRLFKTRLKPVFPVTAFAAVSLTLVLVCLVMSPLSGRHTAVVPPGAVNAVLPSALSLRTVTIAADETLAIDGRRVSEEELARALGGMSSQVPPPVLMVRGAKGLSYRRVKAVLDLARAQGVKDIRLEVAASTGKPVAEPVIP